MTISIPCYDIFKLTLPGPQDGNPFTDVTLSARFQHRNRTLEPEGFYDSDGRYLIRLMPDEVGEWHYTTKSNLTELNGIRGSFECVPARSGVHGPVRVANTYHFAYADGTRHLSFGTTCYAWVNQSPELQEQTLKTLASAPFNKIRVCIFPKDYTFNKNDPPSFPYLRASQGDQAWDFSRFNVPFWQNFEQRVGQLAELGIEADIILFHPYDRWGFSKMGAEKDDRLDRVSNSCQPSGGIAGQYILHYFGRHQPGTVTIKLPEGEFRAEVIDTWEMIITPVSGVFRNQVTIPLPGKPYMAVRIVKNT